MPEYFPADPAADQAHPLDGMTTAQQREILETLERVAGDIPVTDYASSARLARPLKCLGYEGYEIWDRTCRAQGYTFSYGEWDSVRRNGQNYWDLFELAHECRQAAAAAQERAEAEAAKAQAPTQAMSAVTGNTFLTPAEQPEYFKGCVYVLDQHRVLIPGGRLLKPEQFRAHYGGCSFVMDLRNEKTTRDAFEAFTQTQALRKPCADDTCFRPLLPYGEIVQSGGRRLVNTYYPEPVTRKQGDPGPFVRHIAKLFPDEGDQRAVRYYLANMVQRVGHKFQFAPVLIGVAGNGKTFLSRCVAYALGPRYVHWPDAQKIGGQFNGWLFGRVAYLVEDAYLGGKVDLLEKLKPMITGDCIEVEGKGVDQRSEDVCGNFIFNANHQNAVRKTIDDRRYMTLWCAQQAMSDLERDGLTPDYFDRLYGWANADGYAIVAEYLHTLPIPPEYGRSWVMGRAPKTSSTARAIEATRSPIEQEIMAAVENEEQGFRGGWISATYLRKLVEKMNLTREVQRNHFAQLLEGLGYIPHPSLASTGGQVHNPVLPDGNKPRLFVKRGSVAAAPMRPADVADAYSKAQGVAGVGAPSARLA